MDVTLIKKRTFYGITQEKVKSIFLTKIIGILIFIFLTALGAYIYIPLPFTPVPITLQTFFVILSGAMLGPWEGFSSQLGYLILGTMGMPIFFGGRAGLIHLLGPTGGYLWGFLFSSWLVGKLVYRKKLGFFSLILSFSLGMLTIYLFGLIQLSFFVKKDFLTLLQYGAFPFILPDFLKTILLAKIFRFFSK